MAIEEIQLEDRVEQVAADRQRFAESMGAGAEQVVLLESGAKPESIDLLGVVRSRDVVGAHFQVAQLPEVGRAGIVGMKRRWGHHGTVVARSAPPNIHALTVCRRGAYREVSRHGYHRPGFARARESAVDLGGRRHDHRPPHRDEPGAVHCRVGRAGAGAHSARGEHGARVGGAPSGVARPRSDRGGPELRADVCQSLAALEDG